jgi:hypothetical protein
MKLQTATLIAIALLAPALASAGSNNNNGNKGYGGDQGGYQQGGSEDGKCKPKGFEEDQTPSAFRGGSQYAFGGNPNNGFNTSSDDEHHGGGCGDPVKVPEPGSLALLGLGLLGVRFASRARLAVRKS